MTGFDLNKAMTDIDERFIEEAEIGGKKTLVTSETGNAKKGRRKVFRVALIAACMVVLLAGTVAAATGVLQETGIFKKKSGFKTIGSDSEPEEIGEAYIPMGICKEGNVKVTLEDVIGDKDVIYMEFSTNISVDKPDGWLTNIKGTHLTIEGDAVFDESEYHLGSGSGYAPFCKDGKLWYLYYLTSSDVDYSHRAMHIVVSAVSTEEPGCESFVFDWTNNYDAETETIPVNTKVGSYFVTGIELSKTRMMIHAETDYVFDGQAEAPKLPIDYVKLADGSIWYYDITEGVPVKHLFYTIPLDDGMTQATWNYNLLGEFVNQGNGEYHLLPYEQITSISIGGTVITLR